jgi:hypothetical protein
MDELQRRQIDVKVEADDGEDVECAVGDHWLYADEQLVNTPSRDRVDARTEVRYAHESVNMIFAIGKELSL